MKKEVPHPSTVLFDMDGVLFDTMPVHAATWYETAQHFGLNATPQEFYLYEGQKGEDTITHLYQRELGRNPSSQEKQEVYNYKTRLFAQRIVLKLIPGVQSLVSYLAHKGYNIGVVTGSAQQNSVGRITHHFGEYINPKHIISANDVTRGKPYPDPYYKGMELFGATPNETVVIENAPFGVRAAATAGCYTIAVTTGPVPEEVLYAEGANLVLPNMAKVLEWWNSSYPNE